MALLRRSSSSSSILIIIINNSPILHHAVRSLDMDRRPQDRRRHTSTSSIREQIINYYPSLFGLCGTKC